MNVFFDEWIPTHVIKKIRSVSTTDFNFAIDAGLLLTLTLYLSANPAYRNLNSAEVTPLGLVVTGHYLY
jgi:hypothetical protein